MNYLTIFCLICLILLQINCSTEPEELKLEINDGYYQQINNELKYSYEFNYTVSGNICYVGGYAIKWNDIHQLGVDWYSMQKIEPGKIYTIHDTLKVGSLITGNPLIQMQGYLENVRESDSRLKAEYHLKKK